ncbi:MAG: NTP transferase domain-containing protein [Bacteroidales bacterium]|jgi:NDP-sugar pyrophosphorylase family protein|nr:NTP transferase domain-containing protein [Bacteroidales bacterium]
MNISAMILAAGLGTRLAPLTNDKPKALVEVGKKTLLEQAINKVIGANIHQIVINIHHFGNQIVDFVNQHSFDADILISDETPLLKDTAGGFKQAENFFLHSDHILLYNVDILSSIDLMMMQQTHIEQDNLATIAVRDRQTERYFIFDQKNMQLCGWKNNKTGEVRMNCPTENPVDYAFSGIHFVKKNMLNYIQNDQKLSFTPLYLELCKQEKIVGYLHQNDAWNDVGKLSEIY